MSYDKERAWLGDWDKENFRKMKILETVEYLLYSYGVHVRRELKKQMILKKSKSGGKK